MFAFISRNRTRTGMWIRVVETEVDLRRPWMREGEEEDRTRTMKKIWRGQPVEENKE